MDILEDHKRLAMATEQLERVLVNPIVAEARKAEVRAELLRRRLGGGK